MNESMETTHLEEETTTQHIESTSAHETKTHATTEHAGPHIPSSK